MSNTGKKFEELLKTSAKEQGWDANRMKDAGFMKAEKSQHKRFTPKNICDFTLFGMGHLYYVECKSSEGNSFAFSRATQQKALMQKCRERTPKVHAGYLLSLHDGFFYVPAYIVEALMKKGVKKSVNARELDVLGFKLGEIKTARQKKARIDLSCLPATDFD